MEDTRTNTVATMAKGLPRFNGKDKHAYRDWKARVKVHLNMSAPDIYNILMGQEEPNPTAGGDLVRWQRNNANLYSVLFLATNGGATTVVRRHEGKKPEDGLGDGQAAWQALEEKYDAVSNATRQELYEELAKTKMKQDQDPDDFLYIMETARDRLHDMGEHITPERFGDLLLNALTPDYNFVRNTSFRDRDFGLEDIKSTMRNMYAYLLSRPSSTPSISGRGVAMQAHNNLSRVKCYICREFGHRMEDCSRYDPNYNKNRGGRTSK